MADGKYSVDDILSEYGGNSAENGKSDLNIDDIIGGFESKTETAVYNKNTAAAETAMPRKANAAADKTVDGPTDDFSKKYAKLSTVTAVKERTEEEEPFIPAAKSGHSFSDKFEKPNLYGENGGNVRGMNEKKNDSVSKHERSFSDKFEQTGLYGENGEGVHRESAEPEKQGLSAVFRKKQEAREKAQTAKNQEPPIQSVSDTKKTSDDPFEKYSAIEEHSNDNSTVKSIDDIQGMSSEKNLEDILNEYAATKKKPVRNENTQHKSITEFFTKLIPKDENEDEGISGNTELIDGLLKAKKERISRTQHIAPIERKSISDIDLNLDDKILPDTAQFHVDKENSEQEKIKALKERRSKKIKDFVLVGDEEDVEDEEAENDGQPVVIDDFENFNDAPSIAHDIAQLKGSLILRLMVLAVCFAASLYIAVANDTQAVPVMDLLNKRSQTNTYLFVNAILGLLAAFSSYTVISCGLSKLVSFKADCDSLCAVSTVASIASTMIMYANGNLVRGSYVHIYVPVAIASPMFNTLGKLFIVKRTQSSFKFVSGSSEKYAVFHVDDEETAQSFTRGALSDFPNLASMRKTEFLSEFLKTSYAGDSTDSFCRVFTPVVMAAAVVIGLIAGILGRAEHGSSSVYIGISVFVGVISICTGFSTMLIVNLPMLRAAKKNSELGGVVLGYDSIDEFSETNSLLVDAVRLFPQGSVKLAAIKVFSDTRIDEAIVEAASLATQAGSILKNMFYDIIAGKTELLNPVESYIYEDSMGLCGWINNKRVLLGNRELMVNHSIEGMPPASKEKEYTENGRCAVYLSISGELSAMFLVEVNPSMEVRQALQELQKSGVYVMVRSVDSLVTINRLSELFEISPEYLKLIPFRVHEQFNEVTAYQVKQKATLACSGRFAALSSLVLSCRYIKNTITVGIGLQAVAMFLGMLICLAMVILNCFQELSATMLITYNLVFTAALVVFQTLRKN